jgi:hypothetical protein
MGSNVPEEERQDPSDTRAFDGTFEGTRQRQILLGLELEPAERLRWLERTMAELRALKGRAGQAGLAPIEKAPSLRGSVLEADDIVDSIDVAWDANK